MMDTQVSVRKKYTLTTERDPRGNYIKFVIRPNSYNRSRLINCLIILVVNYLVFTSWLPRLSWLPPSFSIGSNSDNGTSSNVWFLGTKLHLPRSHIHYVLIHLSITLVLSLFLQNPTVESLTVFKGYGIQTSETRGFSLLPDCVNKVLCPQEVEFIPRGKIVDIVINEGFVRQCQVIFYLAVIVRNAPKLKLLFPHNRPRLVDQKLIYNLARDSLYVNKKPFSVH